MLTLEQISFRKCAWGWSEGFSLGRNLGSSLGESVCCV